MDTNRDKVLALHQRYPNLLVTAIARRLGITRERVRQIIGHPMKYKWGEKARARSRKPNDAKKIILRSK